MNAASTPITSDGSRPQRVLVLDVQAPFRDPPLTTVLPATSGERRIFRIRDHLPDLEGVGEPGKPISFSVLAPAVVDMVAAARQWRSDDPEWIVLGKAPLPLFALLGFELSAWAKPVTFVNERKPGQWDVLRLDDAFAAVGEAPLRESGFQGRQETTSRVALFVSTQHETAPTALIREYLRDRGEDLGGVVQLCAHLALDSSNARDVANQLAAGASALADTYPFALIRGIVLVIVGPASLAFIAGRAINRNIVRETLVPNFSGGAYQDALVLPLPERRSVPIDPRPEAEAARRQTWSAIKAAFEQLQHDISPDDLPQHPLVINRDGLVETLRTLRFPTEPHSESFRLRILERDVSIGHGLLEALRTLESSTAVAIGKQLLVHEVFHYCQDLTYANYQRIGRSDVALDEVDFWADAYAVETLGRLHSRVQPIALVAAIARELEAVLSGIVAFDRAEHGTSIRTLYERRLRRYLIWALQRARIDTIDPNRADSSRLISELLQTRLIATLSPLSGQLDSQGDKFIGRPFAMTELVVVAGAKLARISTVNPANLIEFVRNYRLEDLRAALAPVVTNARGLLAPWRSLA